MRGVFFTVDSVTPPGSMADGAPATGGLAALNHRLFSATPPGSRTRIFSMNAKNLPVASGGRGKLDCQPVWQCPRNPQAVYPVSPYGTEKSSIATVSPPGWVSVPPRRGVQAANRRDDLASPRQFGDRETPPFGPRRIPPDEQTRLRFGRGRRYRRKRRKTEFFSFYLTQPRFGIKLTPTLLSTTRDRRSDPRTANERPR
jgi:hypothetical protein